jgi:Phytanoyl-CoA dioxygenase (PhyH)
MEDAARGFHGQGFAILPPFLDPALLQAATERIEAIRQTASTLPEPLRRRLIFERELPATKRQGIAPEATGDALFLLGDPPAFDPLFAALVIDPRLVDLTCHLLGTREIRYHFSNVTMKSARVGSSISWHRDFPNQYLCPQSSSFLRLMVCLDGMDTENGATRFVVDSHRISDNDARAAVAARETEAPNARMVSAYGPPGAVVAIHPKSIHGGPPNTSPRPRRNLVIQWGRADDPLEIPEGIDETLAGFSVAEIEAWLKRPAAAS